jgi:tRNA nucleotidyltransferase (CCA-adding enzyme)
MAVSPPPASELPQPGENLAARLKERLESTDFELLQGISSCAGESGMPAWLVGGPVRDLLLGTIVRDLDVVVEGDGARFARRLATRMQGEVKEHGRFGTASVHTPAGQRMDVAGARRETYATPGALPEIEPTSLEEDLLRRDFSINAMAIRLDAGGYGDFVDPVDGRHDLDARQIRVLHDGSFVDDPTRILRAARFAARFSFRLEASTERLLAAAVEQGCLATVSGKRIGAEMVALLNEDRPELPIQMMQERGVWKELFGSSIQLPEPVSEAFVRIRESVGWYRSLQETVNIPDPAPWIIGWLRLTGTTTLTGVEELTHRLQMGPVAQAAVTGLTDRRTTVLHFLERPHHGADSALYEALKGISPDSLIYLVSLSAAAAPRRRVERYLRHLRNVEPWVNGSDLLNLGMEEGSGLGDLLERLLHAQLDGRFASRDEAMAEARRIVEAAGMGVDEADGS